MPPTTRLESMEKFFLFDVDILTRTLYIGTGAHTPDEAEGGIDSAAAERAVKGLQILDTYPGSVDQEIKIIINCSGGHVDHGLAIYDAINACENFVRIEVLGRAWSMASILLQAGDERILHPFCSMMIHEGTTGMCGEVENVRRMYKFEEALEKRVNGIYLERIREKHPKFTNSQLLSRLRHDTWLFPEEAVNLGLADAIYGYEKDGE